MSVLRRIYFASISAAVLASICLVPAAARPFRAADLEGRWTQDGSGLVLDVAPCGAHVCAVLVKADASCGPMVMKMNKMDRGPTDDDIIIFEGRLDLPGENKAYDQALVQPGFGPDDKAVMDITAHDALHLGTRNYAFEAYLTRTGPAVCRAAIS